MHEFNDWLMSNDIDPETLSAKARVKLEAQWRAEAKGGGAATAVADRPDVDLDVGAESNESIEAKAERVAGIMQMARAAMKKFADVGNIDKVKQIRGMAEAAVSDHGVSVKDFQLELLRNSRVDAPNPYTRSDADAPAKAVEAAVCRRAGMDNLEKYFDAHTLEQSERHFRRGLSLVGLLDESAKRNGWRGRADVQSKDFLRAAFGNAGGDGGALDIRAAVTGPSTYSLPNILGNIANKFLRIGFEAVDTTWTRISARRSVNDFKTITTATLTGGLIYKKLAPSGEIRHGDIGELAYTNKADTYAIMLGIERTDLINDDTGALTSASRRMGRGAALKINDVFWTVFLNNSSFFAAGNANVITGGTSALSSSALKLGDQKFRVQTDPNGLPLAAMPKILLVPPTLWYTGRELMNSSLNVGTTTANSLLPATNIFQGAYQIESSPYMENSAYTGNSTTAWYILADPNDVPVIEGVFLNGKDTPTVETADADFNHLGIAMRGYLDFGFALQEYRGGVRAAGT